MKLLNSFWFVDVGRLLYNGPTISHFIINCWNQKSNWLNEMNEIEWVGRLVCEWNEWNEESELWNWWKKFNSIEFHGINWANAAWVEWMKRRPKGPNAPRQAQINKLNLSSPAQARWKDWICWFALPALPLSAVGLARSILWMGSTCAPRQATLHKREGTQPSLFCWSCLLAKNILTIICFLFYKSNDLWSWGEQMVVRGGNEEKGKTTFCLSLSGMSLGEACAVWAGAAPNQTKEEGGWLACSFGGLWPLALYRGAIPFQTTPLFSISLSLLSHFWFQQLAEEKRQANTWIDEGKRNTMKINKE